MKAVANATPLIALSIIGELDLLASLFEEVLVPPSVLEEVVLQGQERAGSGGLAEASWIRVKRPTAAPTIEPVLLGLDPGEFEVILLAREENAWALIDERLARRAAKALGMRVKGTMGILLAGVEAGLLGKDRALAATEQLVDAGIRIAPSIVKWFESELRRV